MGSLMNAASLAPALVLNADFRPLNYFPLSLWSWQDAVKAVCLDRVTIISEYEQQISSPSMQLRLPSVIALKEYISNYAALGLDPEKTNVYFQSSRPIVQRLGFQLGKRTNLNEFESI